MDLFAAETKPPSLSTITTSKGRYTTVTFTTVQQTCNCICGIGCTATCIIPWFPIISFCDEGTTTTIVPGPIRMTGRIVGGSFIRHGNCTAMDSGKSAGSTSKKRYEVTIQRWNGHDDAWSWIEKSHSTIHLVCCWIDICCIYGLARFGGFCMGWWLTVRHGICTVRRIQSLFRVLTVWIRRSIVLRWIVPRMLTEKVSLCNKPQFVSGNDHILPIVFGRGDNDLDKALYLGYNSRNNIWLWVILDNVFHIVDQGNQVIHFNGDDLILFDLTSIP